MWGERFDGEVDAERIRGGPGAGGGAEATKAAALAAAEGSADDGAGVGTGAGGGCGGGGGGGGGGMGDGVEGDGGGVNGDGGGDDNGDVATAGELAVGGATQVLKVSHEKEDEGYGRTGGTSVNVPEPRPFTQVALCLTRIYTCKLFLLPQRNKQPANAEYRETQQYQETLKVYHSISRKGKTKRKW